MVDLVWRVKWVGGRGRRFVTGPGALPAGTAAQRTSQYLALAMGGTLSRRKSHVRVGQNLLRRGKGLVRDAPTLLQAGQTSLRRPGHGPLPQESAIPATPVFGSTFLDYLPQRNSRSDAPTLRRSGRVPTADAVTGGRFHKTKAFLSPASPPRQECFFASGLAPLVLPIRAHRGGAGFRAVHGAEKFVRGEFVEADDSAWITTGASSRSSSTPSTPA